jgi:dihydroorotase
MDMQVGGKGHIHEGEVSVRLGLKGIPSLAETLQVSRDLDILEYTGGRLHIPTISTAESVERIRQAKKRGLNVSCSVAIHNLFCTDRELEGFDSTFKVLPPLRTDKDRKALLKALKAGIIDFASSDHSPIDIEEKRLEFDRAAYGTTGLETAFGALRQLCTAEECIEILTRGRSRFGLKEPELKEGQRAVLTLFDPDTEYTLQTKDLKSTSRNCLFAGKVLKGRAYGVIVGSKSNL